MDDIEALHTAARRYCQEQGNYWTARYLEMNVDPSSERAKATFPRYNVLGAIFEEVIQFVPEDFHTLEEARELLALVGQTAENLATKPPNAEISIQVMQEERDKYSQFVSTISVGELQKIERPAGIPYLRIIE